MYGNLKTLRETLGITQKEFADSLSIKLTTYNGYETGSREPKSDFLIAVAKKYGVTIDYLMGYSDSPYLTSEGTPNFKLSTQEANDIKKYRTLDKYGKETVSGVLEFEFKRCKEQNKEEISSSLTADIIYLPDPIQAASAGYGQLADDDTANMIAIQANSITSKANYIMRVSGDSMEPKFFDGQRVLVRNQPMIEPGEIGIFLIEGERYIKIYCGDHLESANPDYPDRQFDEYSKCLGKVLGVLQDEWIVQN